MLTGCWLEASWCMYGWRFFSCVQGTSLPRSFSSSNEFHSPQILNQPYSFSSVSTLLFSRRSFPRSRLSPHFLKRIRLITGFVSSNHFNRRTTVFVANLAFEWVFWGILEFSSWLGKLDLWKSSTQNLDISLFDNC